MIGARRALSSIRRKEHNFVNFLEDLQQRNLLTNTYPNAISSDFGEQLSSLPPVLYAGFDPTAKSLHVGNLLVLSNLIRASTHGIQPIVLIGGATALIGDPSGRSSERDVAVIEKVEEHKESIRLQISSMLSSLDLPKQPLIVDNFEWFGKLSCVDYLRVCKKMQLGEMLRMGAIKSRMNEGISFTEFSYQTMQAYDWLVLAEKYGCFFQVGGSDQLGHLDFGAHYIKRMTGKFAAGVCLPLLTDVSGAKIGKSSGGGSLWLDSEMTSPFHLYQYFAQLPDEDASRLLSLLSLKPLNQTVDILKAHRDNLGKWVAQTALAEEITLLVHGKKGLESAQKCTKALFGGKTVDVSNLSPEEIITMFGNVKKIQRKEVKTFGKLADLTRFDKQKGSVLMKKSAFSVNGEKKLDPTEPLSNETLSNAPKLTVVCWGKRKYQLVEWI